MFAIRECPTLVKRKFYRMVEDKHFIKLSESECSASKVQHIRKMSVPTKVSVKMDVLLYID